MLFILVIEGLNRLISYAKLAGKLQGIKISNSVFITHFIFLDDVILFGKGTLAEWVLFVEIVSLFCVAFGMEVSLSKYSFL